MSSIEGRDYEGLWWLAQAVHADLRERSATNYCLIAGLSFGIVAWVQFDVWRTPQPTLLVESYVEEVVGGLWLLLGSLAILWWTAWSEHRKLRFDHLDVQTKAYEAGYSVDGRKGSWRQVPGRRVA